MNQTTTRFTMIMRAVCIVFLLPMVTGFVLNSTEGYPDIQPRIIGGVEVHDRCSPPYNAMASIRVTPGDSLPVVVCSATMLTEDILVTAGYCMDAFRTQGVQAVDIVIGDRDLLMVDNHQQEIAIESFKIHPSYDAGSLDNNIALIRLAQPAVFSDCVKPATRMQEDPYACTDIDRSCIMVGWGPFAETSIPTNSRLPREAPLTVYGDLISGILSQNVRQSDQPVGSLLAETFDPRVKACQLDWGGVVSCLRNGIRVLKGLIGDHNCQSANDPPIVVTDVTYFQAWIDSCTNNWETCAAFQE